MNPVGPKNQNQLPVSHPAAPKKRRLNPKLRGQFILLISLMFLAVFGLMGSLLLNNAQVNLTSSLNRETHAFTSLATKPIGDSYQADYKTSPKTVKQQMQKLVALNANVSNIAIVNLGTLSQFSLTGKPIDVSSQDLSSASPTERSNSKNQTVLAVQPYIGNSGRHDISIVYQISSANLDHNIQRVKFTIATLVFFGLLLMALLIFELINLVLLKPLSQLSEASEALVQGNMDISKLTARTDEVGELAISINNMATALRTNITKLKELDIQKDEFIKIVSHNLRTPLTIIQSNAAFLDSSQLTPLLKKMVMGIEDSARRLNLFSEQIVTITDYESGKHKGGFLAETSLNEMLGGLAREYENLAKEKNVIFKTNLQNGAARFMSSQYLIAQAVRNLLDNSLKFTPEQGTVELTATVGQKITIIVKDSGIGIKPEEMPRLFTKFHRASDTLVYNYEGTGIGLYVTKLIIDEQKGSIRAESTLGEGTTFTIELPYVAPPEKAQASEQQLSSL